VFSWPHIKSSLHFPIAPHRISIASTFFISGEVSVHDSQPYSRTSQAFQGSCADSHRSVFIFLYIIECLESLFHDCNTCSNIFVTPCIADDP